MNSPMALYLTSCMSNLPCIVLPTILLENSCKNSIIIPKKNKPVVIRYHRLR